MGLSRSGFHSGSCRRERISIIFEIERICPSRRSASSSSPILAKVRQHPDKASYRSALGIAYAGLGRKQDAIREGKAGVELKPVSKDVGGYVQLEVLARIYASVGEQDEALRLLGQILSSSKIMDVRSLRQDPEWKPLRDNPKFQALLRKYGE